MVSRFNCWCIYLHGRLINKVFYMQDCDAEYVRTSLINHDGFSSDITVRKERP
jgi:DNA-binding MltR family transcriptional regulator